jgi:hypothetical protein
LEIARNLLAASNSQDDDAEDAQLVRAIAMAGDWDRVDTVAASAREPGNKVRTLTAAAGALASTRTANSKR